LSLVLILGDLSGYFLSLSDLVRHGDTVSLAVHKRPALFETCFSSEQVGGVDPRSQSCSWRA